MLRRSASTVSTSLKLAIKRAQATADAAKLAKKPLKATPYIRNQPFTARRLYSTNTTPRVDRMESFMTNWILLTGGCAAAGTVVGGAASVWQVRKMAVEMETPLFLQPWFLTSGAVIGGFFGAASGAFFGAGASLPVAAAAAYHPAAGAVVFAAETAATVYHNRYMLFDAFPSLNEEKQSTSKNTPHTHYKTP